MAHRSSRLFRPAVGFAMALVLAASAVVHAQPAAGDQARTEALARRVAERMQALQREADRLAGQSRTLIGDLRRLEIERDLAIERTREAVRAAAEAERQLQETSARLAGLEQERTSTLPDVRGRLVELYKNGGGGYVRLLAGMRDLREFGRATRAVASLAHLNGRRIQEHRQTVEAARAQRAAVQQKTRELQARKLEAQTARAAADKAVAARAALLAQIDSRRDLNAQLAGELQVVAQRLETAVRGLRAGEAVERVSVPMGPFRGALEWPVVGRVSGRFGQPNRMAAGGVRNGIDIAAPEGTPVRAVHPGVVGFAGPFTGYGTLVILDHGANHYSLYGYLGSASVERGARVDGGDELGRVGFAPLGESGLYFEVRVDGRSIDPVQWLKPR